MIILKRWLPAFLLCLLIYSTSSMPGAVVSDVRSVDVLSHKIIHIILYSLLCLSFYRATKNVWLAVLLTVVYGVSDEFHQLFVQTRAGSVIDIVADSLAAFVTGYILWKYYQNLPKKLKNWLKE